MKRKGFSGPWFDPDGYDEAEVSALVAEMDAVDVSGPVATSALVDGSARLRRERREANRRRDAVVRRLLVMPVRVSVLVDGEAA